MSEDFKNGLQYCEDESRRQLDQILEVFRKTSFMEHRNITKELVSNLRAQAKSELDHDVLELATRSVGKVYQHSEAIDQPSLVSSLSGSLDAGEGISSGVNEPSSITRSNADPTSQYPEMKAYVENPNLSLMQASSAPESSNTLKSIKNVFENVKREMRKSLVKPFVKKSIQDLEPLADQMNPLFRPILTALRSNKHYEEEVIPVGSIEDLDDYFIKLKKQQLEQDNKDIDHVLSAIFILKSIQHTCSSGAHDAIKLVIPRVT